MVPALTHLEVEAEKKAALDEITGLKEYVALLESIIAKDEQDILSTRKTAKKFLLEGQLDNYRYLMERINETINRIRTCKKCIEVCYSDITDKEQGMKKWA
jgi:hypothetical protein